MGRPVPGPRAQVVRAGRVGDGDTVALTVREGRLELEPMVVAEPVA